jgi:hypothetical protein
MQLVVGRQFVPPAAAVGRTPLHFSFFSRVALVDAPRLQERPDRLPGNIETDDAARAIDLLDRVDVDEPPSSREEAGANGERIRNVRSLAVHRALDPADHPSSDVGNQVTDRPAEVGEGRFAHALDATPPI